MVMVTNDEKLYDVPQRVYKGMKAASLTGASVGKYLNAQIKSVYRYARQ